MIRYKVCRSFVDYGMFHEVDSIISDASIISNLAVKLWDGTLEKVDASGNVIAEPEQSKLSTEDSTSIKVTSKPKATIIVPKVVTKSSSNKSTK